MQSKKQNFKNLKRGWFIINTSTIHILDNSLINKIAAGEVVERPSSVVKEVVENSIDAGATSITIEIKNGGINQIRITDNGIGIPKNQVKTAFMRHATNKINTFDDLSNILTLGFRGEALSSIASISQVELITKARNEEIGTRIEIHGGNLISEQDIGCADGTTFIMRNLFYNTPARRKFLKKVATESSYISDVVNKMALGHPEIAFKYINNNSVVLNTSGNKDIKTAVFYIYGKDTAKNMIEFEYEKNGFRLTGLLGKPEISRANRGYENFFINGRFVKSVLVQSAAEEAYKEKMMIGKFPVFVINMTVPANTIDVNVHPTKLEVRFLNEDFIFDMIYNSIKDTFKDEILIPKINLDIPKPKIKQVIDKPDINDKKDDILDTSNYNYSHNKLKSNNVIILNEDFSDDDFPTEKDEINIVNKNKISKLLYDNNIENKIVIKNDTLEDDTDIISNYDEFDDIFDIDNKDNQISLQQNKSIFYDYKIIGQIFNTYWIVEQKNSMYLIDQHAAHERILYENLLEKAKSKDIISQQLLQPIIVNLSPLEKQIVVENIDVLENFGFELEEFGLNSYALKAVPFIFNKPLNSNFFIDIINMIQNKEINNIYDSKIEAIAMMSCKAAVKGNTKMNIKEAEALIEKIMQMDNPFTCPHGRPTIIEITKYELEKKFKRIQS